MSSSKQSETSFKTARNLPFSPTEIFQAFADSKRLAAWWGPDGFTNSFELFEFKPGGNWKFVMHSPDGINYPNENRFLEINPFSKIVIRHLSVPCFTLTIALEPEHNGTHLSWTQTFDDSKVAAAVKHIVEPSNEQNLNRLHALLKSESPT